MITDKGKNLIAKYLVGQTPAYASYIALGSGAMPQKKTIAFVKAQSDLFSAKTALEFEMFRVPIISKGYINEDGVSKIVLTAEMPTADRYGITEIGVYPALVNPAALRDSSNIFSFTSDEGWGAHIGSTTVSIPVATGDIDLTATSPNTNYVQTNVDNKNLSEDQRLSRQEQLRASSNAIYLRGDFSTAFTYTSGSMPTLSGNYITIQNPNIDLSQNNLLDELRLAFSVISTDATNAGLPASVKIAIHLLDGSSPTPNNAVIMNQINSTDTPNPLVAGDYTTNTAGNRYVVSKIPLGSSNFYKDANFDSANIQEARVYVNITDTASSSTAYWIGLDGLRLENLSDISPLYALSAYTTLKNSSYATNTYEYASPAIKALNTSGLVEFKFTLDVT